MCGIAGFVDAPDVRTPFGVDTAQALVKEMCRVIRHRGPDDEGVLTEPGVALGMRRLSIIDVSTGHQPIHNEDGAISIVFNGEIYNFQALRRELESCGHRFSTATDTETIVHAYEQWGIEALGRLRGMFGLALWNRRTRTLVVARDRVGIKPMHYAVVGGRLYFGSEIKSLLCAPDLPRDLNPDALDHYLSFLYAPADASFFTHIRKLPPGHVLSWRDGLMTVVPYWRPGAIESFKGTEADAADELKRVLMNAVRLHLISDVPLGAFLSGGVDSSLVVAMMSRVSGARVKTFSIGFDQPQYDELQYARQVADYYGTDHHEEVVTPDGVAILDTLVSHFDEPFGDPSAIPTWYVSQLAARHVTVTLSGDGGDELFGGYDRYLTNPRVAAIDRYAPAAMRRMAGVVSSQLPHGVKGKRFLRHIAETERGRYIDAVGFFNADDKSGMYTDALRGRLSPLDPEHRAITVFDRYSGLPWASQMMRFDIETYLPEDILTKVDRTSMAHSIEARVPLLDNHVIDFALTLPASMKIREGRRKHVLKEVAAALLPRTLIDRPKQGFGVPLDVWFRGSLRDLFADTLLSSRALKRGYFDPTFIRRVVHEHVSGTRDHAFRLWQLVVLERWHRQYVDSLSGSFLPLVPSVVHGGTPAVAPQALAP
ncbi:MAG TPA: asparagine synthase (glutamine-hydrolyzing) [Vicinamibacterales bacterium]|nr:asparagine synthase (glutamine-hydrolyzing) [Vicinamibacterales bacterium]